VGEAVMSFLDFIEILSIVGSAAVLADLTVLGKNESSKVPLRIRTEEKPRR
jgi:hypothetical protein